MTRRVRLTFQPGPIRIQIRLQKQVTGATKWTMQLNRITCSTNGISIQSSPRDQFPPLYTVNVSGYIWLTDPGELQQLADDASNSAIWNQTDRRVRGFASVARTVDSSELLAVS